MSLIQVIFSCPGSNYFSDGRAEPNFRCNTAVTNTWSQPKSKGDNPAAREGHSAAIIGQKLYIFGGCGRAAEDAEETYFNDTYTLDIG